MFITASPLTIANYFLEIKHLGYVLVTSRHRQHYIRIKMLVRSIFWWQFWIFWCQDRSTIMPKNKVLVTKMFKSVTKISILLPTYLVSLKKSVDMKILKYLMIHMMRISVLKLDMFKFSLSLIVIFCHFKIFFVWKKSSVINRFDLRISKMEKNKNDYLVLFIDH